jgi:hypothetical protein
MQHERSCRPEGQERAKHVLNVVQNP